MNSKLPTASILLIVTLIGGSTTGCSRSETKAPETTASSSLPSPLVRADSHFLIEADSAEVTVVLFTDFQCSYCARLDPLISQATREYAGRINLAVRNFPLPMNQNAKPAAQAVEAAAVQGKMSEMMELVFAGQKDWSGDPLPQATFSSYAKQIGLDMDRYAAAYTSAQVQQRIAVDTQDALSLGLKGTPTLLLNGEEMRVDSTDYSSLQRLLDDALAAE